MVGAGAVVTRDVPPYAIVVGNPARIRGYMSAVKHRQVGPDLAEPGDITSNLSRVRGVRLIQMPRIEDMRGMLSFAEIGKQLPFTPKRYFVVYDVPSKDIRGEHAHKELEELLICVKGSCSFVVDDGEHRAEVELNAPHLALYLPPMVWRVHYKYSQDAVLIALASDVYSAGDYIRDYDEFLMAVSGKDALR